MTKTPSSPRSPTPVKSHVKEKSTSGSSKDQHTDGLLSATFRKLGNLSVSIGSPQAVLGSSQTGSSLSSQSLHRSKSMVMACGSSSELVESPESSTLTFQNMASVPSDAFSKDATKTKQEVLLPKVGKRIEVIQQLVACAELLTWTTTIRQDSSLSNIDTGLSGLTPSQLKWMEEMKDRPLEKEYIQQLVNRMVDRFSALPNKTSDAIHDIVLLGPVLDKEHYRSLLNRFLNELRRDMALNTNILQGLVRLVELSPPFYLHADDLTKTLWTIRLHLQDPAQQESEYTVHLTVAISKILVIMVDCEVKDLNRKEEHEPLLEILSKLRKHRDPQVRYHVEYAYRALQLVPSDETLRQSFTRNSIGLAGGLMKVSGAIKLDFGDVPEGIPVVIKSGRELMENLRKYFGSGDKNPWFEYVREAQEMVDKGHLVDFNRLICEVSCRYDPYFQWGVCQILGELAADSSWDKTTREQAVKLLGEMFRSSSGSNHHREVRIWILTLLHNISGLQMTDQSTNPDNDNIMQLASMLSFEFRAEGDEKTSPRPRPRPPTMYRSFSTMSSLLEELDITPSLELVLDRLRCQRREAYGRHAVYIPPMSKSSLQASDEDLQPLHGRVNQFLKGKGLVMLILGDSGAGKSTFNMRLEYDLWDTYQAGDPIPLFIDLKTVHRLDQDLIRQHLDRLNLFSDSHVEKLRSREFILICDGYDESQSRSNLHTNNQFNRPNQWKTKMVISCRTQYLTPGYRSYFAPQQDAINNLSRFAADLFSEAAIVPFRPDQIKDYITQYTSPGAHSDKPRWTTERYMDRLERIAHIMDLIKNPFMLRMVLDILPELSLTTTQITRAELYDEFVDMHFDNELNRLMEQRSRGKMDSDRLAVFQEMEGPFIDLGINFSKGLAEAIFKQEKGVNSIEYWSDTDRRSWKRHFLGPEPKTQILMESSQLIRRARTPDPQTQTRSRSRIGGSRDTFRFSHLSILEYFYSLSFYDPREKLPQLSSTGSSAPSSCSTNILDHPLGQQSLVSEIAVLNFLSDRVKHRAEFKEYLHAIIQLSKIDISAGCAAANAITILVRAGERFTGADLKGIRIPGADLSGGDFDSAQLQGSDMSRTTLRNVWLRRADLSQSLMQGAVFGQYPYLEVEDFVMFCAFSPDGIWISVGLHNGTVALYNTLTWDRKIFEGHSSMIRGVAHSPDGKHIATSSLDRDVRIWDAYTGDLLVSLNGHTGSVFSVAYSPNGQQLASGGGDKTVRLWDTHKRVLTFTLRGHTDRVNAVAYSPSGKRIVSGSRDKTVRLWNALDGDPIACWHGHTDFVSSVAYSPNNLQIASASSDNTVRLWNTQTESPSFKLVHPDIVTFVAYSPSGQQIASGCRDKIVRLWDALTGTLIASLGGHTDFIISIAYSPNGQQIISSSWDQTVRFWDAQTGKPGCASSGHTGPVYSVTYSLNGQQIVSGGWDRTVRLWDVRTGALSSTLHGHTNRVQSVACSLNDHQIVSGSWDRTVRLWNAQTGELCSTMNGHTDDVVSVAYSPCSRQVASGSRDRTVRLWDVQTGLQSFILGGHIDDVTSVVYSPKGQCIASGSRDRTVRLWHAWTGEHGLIMSGHTDDVISVAYSPNGRQIASGSRDRTVRLWDPETGKHGFTLHGHTLDVDSVAYSPTGHQIATGSLDKTVRLWDVGSGQCLLMVNDFQERISSVAWRSTLDSIYLATGCEDRSVRSWQVVEGQDGPQLLLQWRSSSDTLVLSNAHIEGVQGLGKVNKRLLKQHQAVGQPAVDELADAS
ncbi:hypothetical protein EMPS_06596 [Entomortierella parvispora]|uniref:NACHT domain-containing protein n=1 Tax=Entomortierella parvispora TaxID=205924 RepID=A0A9P3HDA4_9FUNG|nr:hypothetical protein EMPS_06596 [Entomortierella parvispora]